MKKTRLLVLSKVCYFFSLMGFAVCLCRRTEWHLVEPGVLFTTLPSAVSFFSSFWDFGTFAYFSILRSNYFLLMPFTGMGAVLLGNAVTGGWGNSAQRQSAVPLSRPWLRYVFIPVEEIAPCASRGRSRPDEKHTKSSKSKQESFSVVEMCFEKEF